MPRSCESVKMDFICPFCFCDLINAKSHQRICCKNKDNLQKCTTCEKEFKSSQQLFQHYMKCAKLLCRV